MDDLRLTPDEKMQVIRQRIKNLEVERFNRELSLELLQTAPGDTEAAKKQLNDELADVDQAIAGLTAIGAKVAGDTAESNGVSSIKAKARK